MKRSPARATHLRLSVLAGVLAAAVLVVSYVASYVPMQGQTGSQPLVSFNVIAPPTVTPGVTAEYSVLTGNANRGNASDAVITFPVPAGLAFLSADEGCSLSASAPTVICPIGTLTTNKSITKKLRFTVSTPCTDAKRSATASLAFKERPIPLIGTFSTQFVCTAKADLATALFTATPSTLSSGQTSNLTYQFRNLGPFPVQNVTVKFTLPAGFSLVSGSTSVPGSTSLSSSCTQQASDVLCPIPGTLAVSQAVTIVTMQVKAENSAAATARITATVNTPSVTDPVPGNNGGVATLTISQTNPSADLMVSLPSPPAGTTGKPLTYAIRVKNNGPAPSGPAVLSFQPLSFPNNPLPKLAASTPNPWTGTSTFSQSIPSLPASGPESTKDFLITLASFPFAGVLNIQIKLTPAAMDPVPGNNTVNLTTKITNPPR